MVMEEAYRDDLDFREFILVANLLDGILGGPVRARLVAVMMTVVDNAVAEDLQLIGAIGVIFENPVMTRGNVGEEPLPHLDDF